MLKNYLLILLTVLLGVVAQTSLKIGMKQIGEISKIQLSILLPFVIKAGTNLYIILGLLLFVVGTFFWLVLLSRLDLSFLYPFGSLQYLFVLFVSYFILGEVVRPARVIGVVIILLGIFVLSKFG